MSQSPNNKTSSLVRQNVRLVKELYPGLAKRDFLHLRSLTSTLRLSVSKGELLYIGQGWYVTHGGLLQIALRRRCVGIQTIVQERLCDPSAGRWVFKAVVSKSGQSKKFSGYGDADPSNVSPLVRGAEMRVAETRAVNRALRKAYGIGLCSAEELGWTPRASGSPQPNHQNESFSRSNGNGHSGPPRLRDRLCILIREHQLDPILVKAYAADYCGTPALHNARREQVEAFINHLTERAKNDRAALLCHLNSFGKPQEVSS
jgi:hypothetical protein